MKSSFRISLVFAVMVLLLALAACAPALAPEKTVQADQAQPAVTAAQPENKPSPAQNSGSSAVIACDKMIPADEAALLLNRLPATLAEKSTPGETTCTWQYTSKNSGKPSQFQVQAGFGNAAVDAWNAARKAELSGLPSDLAVASIDGLGDESYAWTVKQDNTQVVYVRRGGQTLILRFQSADVLYLGNESGMIDTADRVFNRLGS